MKVVQITSWLLAACLLLTAVGCGGSKSTEPATKTTLPPGRIPHVPGR